MFLELKDKENEFRKSYFEALKYRMAFSSLELEGIDDDLADVKQTMKIYNQLNAINYLFDTSPSDYNNHFDFLKMLCEVADKVSGGEISDFRKTTAMVKGSNVERTEPNLIRNDLLYLIDDYNYRINNHKLDIFETEAMFHIRLLHIHPFEDGNGRTSRIFLAYNLCKNNYAPCIITNKDKKEYCNLIEKGDVNGLAAFFKEGSDREMRNMIALYKDLDEKGKIESNMMSKEQEIEYKRRFK